eukprot:TRINITY_DN17935_c0_g1_i1.p1 TRINITY_DN17935_c0_g1~~TRINITY_DN17935_c0_g1_i1.p1  ORF type:complete len:252 (-),score=85.27 TRINITY_DN17935_c0_g1_i1:7-684(-)
MPSKVLSLDSLVKNDARFGLAMQDITQRYIDKQLSGGAATLLAECNKLPPTAGGAQALMQRAEAGAAAAQYPPGSLIFPLNKDILAVHELIKKETIDMIEILELLKAWIQFNVPRLEEGDNFGVDVQKEALGEISGGLQSAACVLKDITKYYFTRAKLISKCNKFPHIKDYVTSLIEVDQKHYAKLQVNIMELRNIYSVLQDLVLKNREKIEKPKGDSRPFMGNF